METKVLDQAELVNQVIDVIVKEGMVDREKVTLDATIESLDLKSIDIVTMSIISGCKCKSPASR